MDDNEVCVTDADTGAQKGSKSQRYDLIPWEAMDEVAMLYARGAVPRPLKRELRDYPGIEKRVMDAIVDHFDIEDYSPLDTLTRTHREEQRQINAAGADLARAAITRRDERGKS